MPSLFTSFRLPVVFLFLACALTAAPLFRDAVKDLDPMAVEGLDPKVASILKKYYAASFGDPANWALIEDFRLEGVLEMPEGTFPFFGYLRKPDYSKIILYAEGASQLVMAYDGSDAWQIVPPARGPVDMPAATAADFVRDASVGGRLLYPTLPGKTIEWLGDRTVGDYRCADLSITLPSGQQITYAIDRDTGLERQKISTNTMNGQLETLTHQRWEVFAGVVILAESIMTVEGKANYTSRIERVEVNPGLVPAMFERPPDIAYGPTSGMIDIEGPFKMPGLRLPANPEQENPFALPDSLEVPDAK